jgi:hypothetical protein
MAVVEMINELSAREESFKCEIDEVDEGIMRQIFDEILGGEVKVWPFEA